MRSKLTKIYAQLIKTYHPLHLVLQEFQLKIHMIQHHCQPNIALPCHHGASTVHLSYFYMYVCKQKSTRMYHIQPNIKKEIEGACSYKGNGRHM
jgi:hypothetical protein